MNTYETTFTVKCPNDSESVKYKLLVESDDLIFVEDINAAIRVVESFGGFHEKIADYIYTRSQCRLTITAEHQGVKVTTTRGVRPILQTRKKLTEAIKKAYFKYGQSNWQEIADDVIEEMK